MASIEKRTSNGTTSYYARYRDPSGHSGSRSFSRRTDAQKFLATTEAAKLTGNYVDACQASRLFRDLAESHWRSYAHTLAADTTRPRKRSNLDNHILPVLGDVPVGSIKPSSDHRRRWPPGRRHSRRARSGRCCVRSGRSSTLAVADGLVAAQRGEGA